MYILSNFANDYVSKSGILKYSVLVNPFAPEFTIHLKNAINFGLKE